MSTHGKNINIFLMDGTASGRIKCTMANWTGIVYKIPRVDIDLCKDRNDLKQSGIYFLFGTSDDTLEPVVYVGQAGVRKTGEGILYRLQEHRKNPDKDYWSEAVVFTTSNNSFGPTEISYLENRFCMMATEAHRSVVKNSNEPTQGNITEEKESELEEFIEYAKIILGVLGHRIFEPLVSEDDTRHKGQSINKASTETETDKTKDRVENTDTPDNTNKAEIFYIKTSKAQARGMLVSDGFVVLEGSILRKDLVPSCPLTTIRVRERRKDIIDSSMTLTKSIQFASPSGASCFVLGRPSNGNVEWKTDRGITLGEYESLLSYK